VPRSRISKRVYLDNTATTKTRLHVAFVINNYFLREYANPSANHRSGLVARGSMEMARERIAAVLKCSSQELVFTGSGSESNNLAIRGAVAATGARHVITSQIEHSSVLKTCKALEADGVAVTYLAVDGQGRFDLAELERSLRPETALVSLMWVNNEIGTVEDVEAIVRIVKKHGALLHIDAVQALPYLRMNLGELGADLVSFSGHKLYAPKGVGLLYVRRGTPLTPIITGGGQEFDLRSGTENVPYIVGLARAIRLNHKEKDRYVRKLVRHRDRIIREVLATVPDAILTGSPDNRSANHVSFCFKGINGKMLVKKLAYFGLEASSGSACSSPRNDPSSVLVACGVPDDYLRGSLRITLGRYNSRRDVSYLLKVLPRVINQMRTEPEPYNNETVFISQDELDAKLDAGEPVQVLDLRSPKIPPGEIPGAVTIPFWALRANLRKLDRERETVVVCYHGDVLSPEAQQLLIQRGFAHVRVLKGGYSAYADAHRA